MHSMHAMHSTQPCFAKACEHYSGSLKDWATDPSCCVPASLRPCPQSECPSRLFFVLQDGEKWVKASGGDFVAELRPF